MWALMHFIDNKNSLLETMKWNLIFLAWVIGICTLGLPQAHYLSRWSVLCSCILLGIALLIGYAKQYFLQLKNSQILIHILIALAAFFAAVSFADHQLQQRLSLRQTQVHQAEVVVYVDRMSVLNKDNKQQILQVWDASDQQMMHWLARIPTKQPELQLGQYYRLTGQVRPAHGYAIKGGFDQEKWFLQQNLMASFQVKQFELLNKSQALTESSTSFVQRHRGFLQASRLWIEQKRLNCRNWLMQSPLRHRGLLLALLTGDESLLDDITQQQFQNLGIQHLLAISGPHVLVFAMLLCFMLHHLIARFCPELYLRMPKQLLLSLPFLTGIWVYCGFVGFEIPALRTLLMSSLIVLAMWCQRRLSVSTTLLASAALMLLFDPFSMLSVGFWLSYGLMFYFAASLSNRTAAAATSAA
jgi:competence protein ComEC